MLTHEQMVVEALYKDQAECKHDGQMTNQDVQAYIHMNFNEQVTTGEISDIRNDIRAAIEERPFWYQNPKIDPLTDPYWR